MHVWMHIKKKLTTNSLLPLRPSRPRGRGHRFMLANQIRCRLQGIWQLQQLIVHWDQDAGVTERVNERNASCRRPILRSHLTSTCHFSQLTSTCYLVTADIHLLSGHSWLPPAIWSQPASTSYLVTVDIHLLFGHSRHPPAIPEIWSQLTSTSYLVIADIYLLSGHRRHSLVIWTTSQRESFLLLFLFVKPWTGIFTLCRMPLVKNHPHIPLKTHISLLFELHR